MKVRWANPFNALSRPRIVLLGFGLAALLWVLDSLVQARVFHRRSFLEELRTPTPGEVWVRLPAIAVLMVLAFTIQFLSHKRRETVRSLRESEEKFRTIFESAGELITYVHRDGRILDINPRIEDILGYRRDEVIGKELTELGVYPEGVLPKVMDSFLSVTGGGLPSGQTVELRHRKGRAVFLDSTTVTIEKKGRVDALLIISRDVTARIKAEENARLGEERWRCLTSSNDDFILVVKEDEEIEYINRTFPPQTPADVVGRKLTDFVEEAHRETLKSRLKHVFRTGETIEYDVTLDAEKVDPAIGTSWFSSSIVPMISDGKVVKAIVVAKDVTERKMIEQALRESEERLLGIINSSPDPMVVCDVEGNIVQCNEACRVIHGFSSQKEMLGLNVLSLAAPSSKQRVLEALRGLPEGGIMRDLQATMVSRNGREFPAELSGSVVRDVDGRPKYMVGVAKDVTERLRAEMGLRDAEEKWTSLMENTGDIITVMDRDGRVQYTNRALLPYSPEDTVGRTMFEFIGNEQHGVVRDTLNRVFQTGVAESYELRAKIAGVGVRWFATKMVPIKREGSVVSVITIATDVTDRKAVQEEMEKVRQQLAYAEKMESLGHLARGVAHEINNPLTSVLATAELVLKEMVDGRVSKSDIDQIVSEARRIQETVKSFLAFAKARDFVFQESDINAVVTTALRAVGKAQLRGCEVVTVFDQSLEPIRISTFHIQEVFVNMITNALHSMRSHGKLTITTAPRDNGVVVSIKDTGAGIKKADLPRIFEPYFTTREKRGTGLGLSICRDIIMRHGGKIEVESDGPGRGAEFKVYLPK
ncbi:MAG: PAS domain S-box protein [Candidatus Eiseniibacteriota bacterium]|nr:MAG: PAS domain S-box protein [Candidatus Eisenbacteria bacterium]